MVYIYHLNKHGKFRNSCLGIPRVIFPSPQLAKWFLGNSRLHKRTHWGCPAIQPRMTQCYLRPILLGWQSSDFQNAAKEHDDIYQLSETFSPGALMILRHHQDLTFLPFPPIPSGILAGGRELRMRKKPLLQKMSQKGH